MLCGRDGSGPSLGLVKTVHEKLEFFWTKQNFPLDFSVFYGKLFFQTKKFQFSNFFNEKLKFSMRKQSIFQSGLLRAFWPVLNPQENAPLCKTASVLFLEVFGHKEVTV